jgi:hypothetical protein
MKRTLKTTPYGSCSPQHYFPHFYLEQHNTFPLANRTKNHNQNIKKNRVELSELNRKWRKRFETQKCHRTQWIWKKHVNESSNSSEALVDRYLPSWKFTIYTTSLPFLSFVPPSLLRSVKTITSPIPRFVLLHSQYNIPNSIFNFCFLRNYFMR